MLGGFSQGCVMALALGLGVGRPRPVAICGFSGFIPVVDGWELDVERPLPPVALGHGTFDPVIPVEFGRAARDQLLAAGAELLYEEYPLAAHARSGVSRSRTALAGGEGLTREPGSAGTRFVVALNLVRVANQVHEFHRRVTVAMRQAWEMRPTHAGYYHVTTRSIAEEHIFRDDRDYVAGVQILGELATERFFVCRGFCLMPTHYHLLAWFEEDMLAPAIHRLEPPLRGRLQPATPRRGHVFDSPYTSVFVEDDVHYRWLDEYIAENPPHRPWPWSSYDTTFTFVELRG